MFKIMRGQKKLLKTSNIRNHFSYNSRHIRERIVEYIKASTFQFYLKEIVRGHFSLRLVQQFTFYSYLN